MTSKENQKVLIDIKDLYLEYGVKGDTILALENINLKIEQGEFICLLGPSGCGKSSLLNVMAGFIKPTKGSCLMKGEPITGPDWHRGVVFQSPTLYPWMSVKENVEFGPRMRGLAEDEIKEIRDHFLKQVKLTGFGSKNTFELSGGMKQRVALARVLANYPQMILMDEPLGALDALTKTNMQALIRDIWKETNTTIFLITHDIDEALHLGRRIVVMSKRPGTILKEFKVDFTDQLFKNKNLSIHSDKYFHIKDEILDIINKQIEE